MAYFNTRVELHGATSADYERLHQFMHTAGFSQEVSSGDTTVKLPPGEYSAIGNYNGDDVLAAAKSAASKTGKKFSVRVTLGLSIWFGLEAISKNKYKSY